MLNCIKKMKVVIQKDLFVRGHEVFLRGSEDNNIEFILADVLDESKMLSYHAQGANCFIIGAENYSRSFYKLLKPKSAVIRYGVGYNAVPIDICIERNIAVGFTPDTLTDSVAEHTFAMLLAMNRNIPQLNASMKAHRWQGITGKEIKGKTIAILGFGQIGRAVARIAKLGFGMRVNTFDIKPSIDCDYVDFHSNDFELAVKDADIVSMHMAVSPSTKDFINSERIALCKNGAQFINISRGDLVDEKALFEALRTKEFSAAALDVYVNEPYFPTDYADFRTLDNVVLTPHCGSNTQEASERMAEVVMKNIIAFQDGKEMILIPELKNSASNIKKT